MATISKDPAENLSNLALFIANDVRSVMTASLVTSIANAWFHQFSREEQEKRFRTHPANNIVYAGLKALEEQAIVSIYEVLYDEHDLHPHEAEIRRMEDLRGHRDAISHPMTVKWRRAWMQEFADAGRDGYDWRPAQVWDVQRSINEELRRHGRKPHNETIAVTFDMAASLRLILDLSRLPDYEVPTVELLFACMQNEVPTYQAKLEAHPDGMRDLQKEKERAERRKVRSERWAVEAKTRETTPKPTG